MTNANCDYPEYYGGSYLNDDGNLVILLTDMSDNVTALMKNISQNENLIIEPAQYSYAELCHKMSAIMDYRKNHPNDALDRDISACGLNDRYNYIEVYIKNLTEEKIAQFKE